MIWPVPSREDDDSRGCLSSTPLMLLGVGVLVVAVVTACSHFIA
ncbi:hypothetical protein [Nonomuraea sp. GTA35]